MACSIWRINLRLFAIGPSKFTSQCRSAAEGVGSFFRGAPLGMRSVPWVTKKGSPSFGRAFL